MDSVGPRNWLGETKRYAVVIDHATRFVVAVEIVGSLKAAKLWAAFRDHWITTFGPPHTLLTDHGTEYQGEFAHQVVREWGCHLIHSAVKYPQGNGLNEASHRVLEAGIMAARAAEVNNFNEALQFSVLAHNITPREFAASPYFCVFGREPTLPGWQDLTTWPAERERLESIATTQVKRVAMRQMLDTHKVTQEETEIQVGNLIIYPRGDGGVDAQIGRS